MLLIALDFPGVCHKPRADEWTLTQAKGVSQSISNQTHVCLFRSTPQRSEIISTMGRPHPPLRSGRGPSSDGTSKPGPGSHTLPRIEPAETVTVSKIWSWGESLAWRTLLVTSSLTTSRTSSSFSGGTRPLTSSRECRAAEMASELEVSLRSIRVSLRCVEPTTLISYPPRYIFTPAHQCHNTSERLPP